MFKKFLIVSLISLGGIKARAQYIHYDPIGPATPSTPAASPEANSQIITGYLLDATNSVQKIKLKVISVQRRVIVTGLKMLTDQNWTDYTMNRPVAQKLNSYDNLAKQFEYKVYIPTLSKNIYF